MMIYQTGEAIIRNGHLNCYGHHDRQLNWRRRRRPVLTSPSGFWAECTKIAHRHSLAIFIADSGIARNSAESILPILGTRKGTCTFSHKQFLGHPGHRSSWPGTRTEMFMFFRFRTQHINIWPLATGSGDPPLTQAVTGQNCLCLCAFSFPDIWIAEKIAVR